MHAFRYGRDFTWLKDVAGLDVDVGDGRLASSSA